MSRWHSYVLVSKPEARQGSLLVGAVQQEQARNRGWLSARSGPDLLEGIGLPANSVHGIRALMDSQSGDEINCQSH